MDDLEQKGVPPLPGFPPERTEWCLARSRELFAAGKTVDEVREIMKRETLNQPWKKSGDCHAQKDHNNT